MWKFRNGNAFVLFFWTCYGPLLFDAPAYLVLGQLRPVPDVQLLAGLPTNAGGGVGGPPAAGVNSVLQQQSAASQQQQQQQPCDRTRRVFTEAFGEISDGPAGSNYTQVTLGATGYDIVLCPSYNLYTRSRWPNSHAHVASGSVYCWSLIVMIALECVCVLTCVQCANTHLRTH